MERVVVGMNGSDGARSALLWAWDFASASGREVRVVHVWRPPVPISQEAWADLHRWYAAAQRLVDGRPPPTCLDVAQGVAPGATLVAVAEAEDAPVLVVGAQHHGVGRLLHGSVSHYVLSHATCPVVAVPPPPAERDLRYPDPSELSLDWPHVPR